MADSPESSGATDGDRPPVDSPNLTQRARTMGRRGFLKLAASTAVAAGGALAEIEGGRAFDYLLAPSPETHDPESSFYKPFPDKTANAIAQKLGITSGNFWIVNEDVMSNLEKNAEDDIGFLDEKTVLPIFPPAVLEHADLLAKVADEEGLPVNILATIASMESGGNTNIASRDEHGRIIAQGMIQVVARFHMDKIIPVAAQHGHEIADGTAILSRWRAAVSSHSDTHFVDTIPDIVSAMADPEVNVRVGAMILKEFYERAKEHTQAPDHPVTWVRALSQYNGGGAQASAAYEAMPGESRHYADYAARFFMTAEVATQLRREGYDDNEIQAALHSAETDARAYAYEKYKGKTGVNERSSVDDLNHLWRELAKEKLTDSILVKAYTDYKHGVRDTKDTTFRFPLSPGLRMHLAHGGWSLFSRSEANIDPKNYPSE